MSLQATTIIRVGDDYFTFVNNYRANGEVTQKMQPIKRQTITDDYGREFLRTVPKFQMFCNVPDNDGSVRIPPYLYNLYTPLNHRLKSGKWKWTEILLRHVFGDQYELGLDYIQLIYQQPLQILPVLCLVSKENQTGKTTFLNWLKMIFRENVIIIGNQEISSQFNFMYGYKLIIGIEESRIERSTVQEKIKAMATQKEVVMNEKFQRAHTVDYFGKIILLSNHEDSFISANKEDIRYWIRKIPVISKQNENYNIEDDLQAEVPAFLHFISSRKLSTTKQSRAWFNPDQLETDALNRVREYSHTPLYFDLKEALTQYFAANEHEQQLKGTAKHLLDLINDTLQRNVQYNTKYLTKVLRDEFEKQPVFGRFTEMRFNWNSQPGSFYVFDREEFVNLPQENGFVNENFVYKQAEKQSILPF